MSNPESDSDPIIKKPSIENDITEEERKNIRAKLSNMSFEDLIKLKNKIGSKIYNQTVFDVQKSTSKVSFKRVNRNRPREMSAKIKPKVEPVVPVKKITLRDPRFDPLCGEFDKETFQLNYKFVHDIRKNERVELKKELANTTDPARKEKIKYLIQRMDNQMREQEKRNSKEQRDFNEKRQIKDKLRHGEKPDYKKKSVKKIENLITKYEELKKTNKLQKYIERKSRKQTVKERKKLNKQQL